MRKHFVLLSVFALTLLFNLSPRKAQASHCAGGEIIYEFISDSTYRFFFKFYRDCTGAPAPTTVDLCARNPCDPSWNVTPSMQTWTGALPGGGQNGEPVAQGCAQYPTRCTDPSSPIPGYQEWWYSTIITLPGKCNFWTFSAAVNARNPSDNTGGVSGGNLYIETTFNNLFFQGNSSPYFTIKPVPYVCVNTDYDFNNGAIDPNGDSIVTDVRQPMNGACGGAISLVTMSPGITYPTNPLPCNNTFVVNPKSGQMSFRASQVGVHTLTTRVREYRNGILIGHIMRDVQVAVLGCSAQKPSLSIDISSAVGGNATDTTVYGCTQQNLSFCFDIKVDSPDYRLILADNHHLIPSLQTATTAFYNQVKDSVRGCFSWTPTAKDTGLFGFIVTVKDSTCKPPGIMLYYTYAVPIYIWAPTRALKDTSVCPGQTAFLAAIGGENFEWKVLPGGAPETSITCVNPPNCSQIIAAPLVTTKYHVLSQINPYCAASNRDTLTVEVLPAPHFKPHNDTITCPNNPVKLDLKPTPPPGEVYTYKWIPVTALDNDTSSAPISNPTKDVTYTVIVKTNNSICETRDTIKVDVLDGYTVFNGDTSICEGQTVDIIATGDSRYEYKWEPDPGAQANVSDPTSLTPIITPKARGQFGYTITARFPNCLDSIYRFHIEVQPNPTVTVDEDAKVCFGDTMQLHGIISPADYTYDLTWTPGSALDDPKAAGPIFTANEQGEVTLKLVAISTANCADSDEVKLTVFPAEFLTVSNDTMLCPGDSIQLHLATESSKEFSWYPDINISNTGSLDPMVWPATTLDYYVFGLDTNGCTDTQKVNISVKPHAALDLPDTVRLYPGEAYHMDPAGNCLYYDWFPGVGLSNSKIANPVAQPDVNTRYIVTAHTESGCYITDSIEVLVMPDSRLDVPNAFVPGNGENGKLKIVRLGTANLKRFAVYNRWGVEVFRTADINDGWDGRFNGEPQPMGTYIYAIEATTPSGRTFTKQGNVTLVR